LQRKISSFFAKQDKVLVIVFENHVKDKARKGER